MAKIRHSFDVNILGIIETTKAVLPHFRANRSGTIINVSSLAGKVAFPVTSPYNAVKFAVEGFSEALCYEMESIGVKVKLVEPGVVKTEFIGRSFDFSNDETLEESVTTPRRLGRKGNARYSALHHSSHQHPLRIDLDEASPQWNQRTKVGASSRIGVNTPALASLNTRVIASPP